MDNFQLKEFHKKYNNTCASVLNLLTGKVMAIQFSGIPSNCGAEQSRISLASAWKVKKNFVDILLARNNVTNKTFSLKNIQVLPTPEKQVFDFAGRTIVYNKNPQRQWQSGVNNNNSLFHDPLVLLLSELPSSKYVKFHNPSRINSDIRCLENLFVENHAGSLENAIKEIKEYSILSRTLDKTYFLALSINEKYPYILYRYHIPVAYYNDKDTSFTLTKSIFSQEIYDFCRRRNIFATVKES